MKYNNIFELSSSFETASGGGTLNYPNLSLVEETNKFYIPKPLYEWIDLGLPSGLKWAAWNVGANKPEEFGLYFAWGETEGYVWDSKNNRILDADGNETTKQFSWSYYKLCNGSDTTLTKYNTNSSYGTVDNLTTLEQVDDAASATQSTCRMPTKEDVKELKDNTTATLETLNGVIGVIFTSNINGNSIFIPAAGSFYNTLCNVGLICCVWTSSLTDTYPIYGFGLDVSPSGAVGINSACERTTGFPIRPVKD